MRIWAMGRWAVAGMLALVAMVAAPFASGPAPMVAASRPTLWTVSGFRMPYEPPPGQAFYVRCTINSHPAVCLIDTGNLSGGLLLSKMDAWIFRLRGNGATEAEGIHGVAIASQTASTWVAIGGHRALAKAVIDPQYQGGPLIGPLLLRQFGTKMSLSLSTGSVSFNGPAVATHGG